MSNHTRMTPEAHTLYVDRRQADRERTTTRTAQRNVKARYVRAAIAQAGV